jgi:site-specific DNA-methyltransferase (adenine-specific)
MNQIIQGDCLEVLPILPPATMIFADPPDNLGVEYNGFEDRWGDDIEYVQWLSDLVLAALKHNPDVFWMTYYWKWDYDLKGNLWSLARVRQNGYEVKPLVWWYSFGQHQQQDCASCFRPMLRLSKPGKEWYTDTIREPSARQREYGDKRADPRGRVPGDVWDGVWQESRVCGTFKEKRKWHKNQHPEALIERMVKMSTKPGDLVIDMFAGTGTVNRVCKRLDRQCIGIEISPTYCDKIREELSE